GDVDELAVTMVCQIAGAKDPAPLKVVAVEVHHLRAGRDAGDAVIERGPLLLAERGQRRRLGRGERERAPGVRGRGPMRIARAPEERAARLAEAIERADEREIPQRFLLEAGACCEIVETPERSAAPALLDDRLRLRIAESLHALEPEPHVVNATCPMGRDRPRCVDWRRRRARRG